MALSTIQIDDLLVSGWIRQNKSYTQYIPDPIQKLCYLHFHLFYHKLDPVPAKQGCDHLVKINDYEFITANEHSPPSYPSPGFLKFNTITNEWSIWFKHEANPKIPYTVTDSGRQAIACDEDKKLVYIASDRHLY